MFQVERAYCTLVNAASLTLSKNTREAILNIGDPSSYGCDSSIPHQLILEADVFLFAKKSIWSLEDLCCFPGVYSSMKIQHGLVSKLLDYQDLCVFAALSKTIESHNTVKNHSTKWANHFAKVQWDHFGTLLSSPSSLDVGFGSITFGRGHDPNKNMGGHLFLVKVAVGKGCI